MSEGYWYSITPLAGQMITRSSKRRPAELSAGDPVVFELIHGVYLPAKMRGAGVQFFFTPDGGLRFFSSQAAAWDYLDARSTAEEIAEANPYELMKDITLRFDGDDDGESDAADAAAWAEDEADMQRIADEWAAFDRDPPGS